MTLSDRSGQDGQRPCRSWAFGDSGLGQLLTGMTILTDPETDPTFGTLGGVTPFFASITTYIPPAKIDLVLKRWSKAQNIYFLFFSIKGIGSLG